MSNRIFGRVHSQVWRVVYPEPGYPTLFEYFRAVCRRAHDFADMTGALVLLETPLGNFHARQGGNCNQVILRFRIECDRVRSEVAE